MTINILINNFMRVWVRCIKNLYKDKDVIVIGGGPGGMNAAELLRTLYLSGTMYKSAEWMESSGAFFEGKSLCSTGWLWFCKAESRWPSDIWGEDSRFGYVPFPWPDNLSKEATRVKVGTDEVVWTIAASRERPTYVTDEDLYRMLVDYFYRAKKYQQADPTFDAEAIKRQTLEKKLDDAASECYTLHSIRLL